MNRIRAFFLSTGFGLLAVSIILLVFRPEPSDMRYRVFFGGFMTAGFCFGFLSLLIFSNKWRKISILGAALFGLGILAFYLGGRYGGQSVGSTGWVIGLILITAVFPASLVVMGISGIISLITCLQSESGSRLGFFAGLFAMTVVIAALSVIMAMSPDMDELIASLQDPEEAVRIQAIHRLGAIDNLRGKKALARLLHDDPDPAMRAEAALALGTPPAPHMVIAPLTIALKDENFRVRRNAALSLGAAIGASKRKMYSRSVEALLETLKDKIPEVRAAAAEALGWIGEVRAVEPLIELLNDETARFQAHNALIAITGQRLSDNPDDWQSWLEGD